MGNLVEFFNGKPIGNLWDNLAEVESAHSQRWAAWNDRNQRANYRRANMILRTRKPRQVKADTPKVSFLDSILQAQDEQRRVKNEQLR